MCQYLQGHDSASSKVKLDHRIWVGVCWIDGQLRVQSREAKTLSVQVKAHSKVLWHGLCMHERCWETWVWQIVVFAGKVVAEHEARLDLTPNSCWWQNVGTTGDCFENMSHWVMPVRGFKPSEDHAIVRKQFPWNRVGQWFCHIPKQLPWSPRVPAFLPWAWPPLALADFLLKHAAKT